MPFAASTVPGIEGRVGASIAAAIAVAALCFNFLGGYAMAYVIMLLTLLGIAWSLAWRGPVWRLRDEPARLMIAGAYLVLLVAFAFTSRQWSDAKYALNFVMLLFFVPLSTFLGRYADPRNLGRVAMLALFGSVISLAAALYQVIVLQQPRASGFGSDSIWSAEAAIVTGFLATIGCFAPTRRLPAFVFLLGPVLASVTTVLTGSRGPLLAAPVLGLVVVWLAGRQSRLAFLALVVLLLAALPVVAQFWPAGVQRVVTIATNVHDLLLTGSTQDGSADARLTFWRIGFLAFLRSPLYGYGWAHFRAAAYAYLPDQGRSLDAGAEGLAGNIHLHSDILDLGLSAGLLGLLVYALVIAAPLVDVLRSPRDSQYLGRRLGAALLSAGYLACGLTYLMFGYEFHTTLYVALAALIVSYCRDAPPAPRRAPDG